MSVTACKETRGFETEVKQLLHLMIHALYSNKEIFLRELISNGNDAIDKLRFSAIAHPDYYEADPELAIHVHYDKEAKTITVRDNGIGMSREEVISHLGTIAKSGTQAFLKSLTGDEAKDRQLIGQFGVGFYASFIVAEKVVVKTRHAGFPIEQGVCWTSLGEGEYTVETISYPERGTEVTLHLKAGEEEFLNGFRLRHIVTKYSDHINVPVKMLAEQDDLEEKEKEALKAPSYEVVNRVTALWAVPKSEVSDEAYCEFYKHIAHDFEDPLVWAHNKVEGKYEYITLLYIPSRAPYNLFQPQKPHGLKLYVKRVFIMDEAEQFLPNYLRFVRGVIDSSDLPLNISREILQSNKLVDAIRSAIIKRVLSMLTDLAESDKEKYAVFWKEFGQVLKEGPAEDFANKDTLAKLFRFASTFTQEEKQTVSLDDYLSRMKPGQDKIYYITADTFNAAQHSPHLEIFKEKGIEVLLLHDRVDEWLVAHITEYEKKPLQSVARGDLKLDFLKDLKKEASKKDAQEEKTSEAQWKEVLEGMQKLLGNKVTSIRLSERLTTSSSCLVAEEGQLSGHMQRLLRQAGQWVANKPVLELNPKHFLVKQLQERAGQFEDLSWLLYEQAVLAEGGQLDDPSAFVQRSNRLLCELAKGR